MHGKHSKEKRPAKAPGVYEVPKAMQAALVRAHSGRTMIELAPTLLNMANAYDRIETLKHIKVR